MTHSNLIVDILNLQTRHILPQFHVACSNYFSTTTTDAIECLFNPETCYNNAWCTVCESGLKQTLDHFDEEGNHIDLPELHDV